MTKPMTRRLVEKALKENGCVIKSDTAPHTKWKCPCGKHSANIPRHKEITAGVVDDSIKRMQCLEDGWLQ